MHQQYVHSPNGQHVRIIQGVPQSIYVMQPAPYPQAVVMQSQGVAMQPAAVPMRHNYVNVATPVSVQAYRQP